MADCGKGRGKTYLRLEVAAKAPHRPRMGICGKCRGKTCLGRCLEEGLVRLRCSKVKLDSRGASLWCFGTNLRCRRREYGACSSQKAEHCLNSAHDRASSRR